MRRAGGARGQVVDRQDLEEEERMQLCMRMAGHTDWRPPALTAEEREKRAAEKIMRVISDPRCPPGAHGPAAPARPRARRASASARTSGHTCLSSLRPPPPPPKGLTPDRWAAGSGADGPARPAVQNVCAAGRVRGLERATCAHSPAPPARQAPRGPWAESCAPARLPRAQARKIGPLRTAQRRQLPRSAQRRRERPRPRGPRG